ncbi:DUF3813 domain-containing protein [Bacillus sp. 03113]|uniref:DUF3813 domain-containing protein n=1 Tax=Bacillus sp. 03113 TaxID=2578211 RepID=UPI0011415F6B|nr:DUF3813 domain-containing protein [Bacillus sp. 03113]
MANELFQEARKAVDIALQSGQEDAVSKAKNALTSAFANSSTAEQQQLQELQKQLEDLTETDRSLS